MLNIFSADRAKWVARLTSGLAFGLAFALALSSAAPADPAKPADRPVKLRGTILSVQGNLITARGQDDASLKIALQPATRIAAIVPASLAAIKPGAFVGVTSMPGDGAERLALEVHIFPEALRGTGEGERAWDKGPGSRMTNATVAAVAGVEGADLTLKFHGGETRIKVTPRTKIVSLVVGDRRDLKPGNQFVAFALLGGNGVYTPRAISVGRDGLAPPM